MMNNQVYAMNARAKQTAKGILASRAPKQGAPNTGTMVNTIGQLAPNTAQNPNQITPTPISPTALSNQGTIAGVYGEQNPDTFTRTVQSPPPPPVGVQTNITPDLGY
jgi:hypothetical protein